jgi:GNAT superfamily N-acetyltransferase
VAEALTATRRQRGGAALLAQLTAEAAGGLDPDRVVADWLTPADDRVALVGLFAGEVVGLAAGSLLGAAPAVGRVLGCYVEPDARGVGVGTALLGALIEWFAGRGCASVDATALPGDRLSKQLFEAKGFTTRLLVLRRPSG